MFIDVHIVQTVPFSNLNRDDTGTPKTVLYGGATRARVSSQSWKRATRNRLEEALGSAKTYRTRNPHDRLAELVVAAGVDPDKANRVAQWTFASLGTATKDGADNVILFVAESELEALRDVYLGDRAGIDALLPSDDTPSTKKGKGDKKSKSENHPVIKQLLGCLTVARPTSVALFGRMLASSPEINVDAAVQVAHAFSVHPVEVEIDYFTAAEDLPTADDLTGGAHIGYSEFVAATLYRYATVDVRELLTNIGGDTAAARELAALVLSSFALSLPTGKNNVTAPHTVPAAVAVTVRADRPVSYAAAFEKPVLSRTGHAADALDRLAKHASQVGRMVDPAVFAGAVVTDGEPVDGLGPVFDHLNALIDATVGAAFPAR